MMINNETRFFGLRYPALFFLAVFAAVLFGGITDSAQASPALLAAECSTLPNYGFTQGIVYCVLKSLDTAMDQYVNSLQIFLEPYMFMALMVAIAFFGVRMMTSAMQQPIKESATLAFRISIGLFCYYNAEDIYDVFVGNINTGTGGVMNEAIDWVTGGAGGNLFGNLISAQCPKPIPIPPAPFGGYQVWQAFDCMFQKLFGAVNPATNTAGFATSMLTIVAASLLSGTIGVSVAFLGIWVFFGALKLVTKALFLVLMAYLTIGFLTIFAPLFAPLVFFNSSYLTEKFKQWVGFLLSSAIQPVFVLGFLALAISVDDQIIEGKIANCTTPTYSTAASTFATAPPEGYGQNGAGVCSFTDLFYNGNSGALIANPALVDFFNNFFEQNQTVFNGTTGGSPQGPSQNGTMVDNTDARHTQMTTNDTGGTTPFTKFSSNVGWGGTTHTTQELPAKQMMLTLLTFIFTTYCMLQLMDIIPAMASNMTIGMGVNLYNALQVPFEGAVTSMIERAEDGAKQGVASGGGLGGAIGGAVTGALGLGGGTPAASNMKSADAAKVAAAKKAVSKTKARKAMGTTPGTTQ